jgi:hypothetical protein
MSELPMPLPDSELLIRLASRLKSDGYVPAHWIRTEKGLRADLPGKFPIPSKDSLSNVCMVHGNPVKVLRETYPGQQSKGIRILSVHPCLFCNPSEIEAVIPASPKLEVSSSARNATANGPKKAAKPRKQRRIPNRSGVIS